MKAEPYFLVNDQVRINAISRLNSLDLSAGNLKLVISNAGSKSSRCRGLQWKWYTDIVKSGLGGKHEESKESVHRFSKWKWAIPILLRDDQDFADLWPVLHRLYRKDSEKMKYIVDHFVSTEGDDFAIGEYLTYIRDYYSGIGVNLTDPDDKKLLQYEAIMDVQEP